MTEPKLICLMGAECTGKSTLAQDLAVHFSSCWVPEYLRIFCELNGRTPRAEEQSHILEAQLLQECDALKLARTKDCAHVFCDTAPLLTAIYSECYFSDRSLYERALALHSRYSLTILLSPDLPWRPDGVQRDGVEVRDRVNDLIDRTLALHPHVVRVSGTGVSRVHAAISVVDGLIASNS